MAAKNPSAKLPKNRFITLRLDTRQYAAFTRKSFKYGGNSAVLREFVNAFLDNRVTIQPDPNKETLC